MADNPGPPTRPPGLVSPPDADFKETLAGMDRTITKIVETRAAKAETAAAPTRAKAAAVTLAQEADNELTAALSMEKRRLRKMRTSKRWGFPYPGKYRADILDNIPPIDMDFDGVALRPANMGASRLSRLDEVERKVRFLLFYNYGIGNVTLACQEASITREIFRRWEAEDPKFKAKMREAMEEVADRMLFKYALETGMLPVRPDSKVRPSSIAPMLKRLRPDLFALDEEKRTTPTEVHFGGVSRPGGPAG